MQVSSQLNILKLLSAGVQVWTTESTRFLGYGMLMLLVTFAMGQLMPIGFLLILVLQGPMIAGVVHATRRVLLQERPETEDFLAGFSQFTTLAMASLLLNVLTGLGALFLLIPGLLVMSCFWVLIPLLALESCSVKEAFERCWHLSWPSLLPLVVLRLLFLMLQALLSWPALSMLLSGGQPGFTELAPGLLASLLLGPFDGILATLAYFRLRGDTHAKFFEA